MKKITTGLMLLAALVSIGMKSAMLHADELLTRQRTLSADGQLSLATDGVGHSGRLDVHGALVSSPCLLKHSTLSLSTAPMRALSVDLTGCGYGESLSGMSASSQAPVFVTISARLGAGMPGETSGGVDHERLAIHGGSHRLYWLLSSNQRRQLATHTAGRPMLYLGMAYE